MATSADVRTRRQKRRRVGIAPDNQHSLPVKNIKPSENRSSDSFPPPEFWDNLPNVWLTARALRELDRRNKIHRTTKLQAPHQSTGTVTRFSRHGGPDLRDLRGYPEPGEPTITMSSSRSRPSTTPNKKTKRTSAYDRNFEEHLTSHGVYPVGYQYPDQTPEPNNLEEIQERLKASRRSLSPSRLPPSAFVDFRAANSGLKSESKVMSNVLPTLRGRSDILNEENVLFNGLDELTDGTIVDAKPDFYDGTRPSIIQDKVKRELGHLIMPSSADRTIAAAPNFFTEVKPAHGALDVAKRQACYDGALGARAMHGLQSYGEGKHIYDGNAYTITSTYYSGSGLLELFAVHPTEGPDKTVEYHMTPLDVISLTLKPDSFRQGIAAFRNARDWAKEQRDKFIARANARAVQLCREINESSVPNSDSTEVQLEDTNTSAEELEAVPTGTKRPRTK